MVQSSKFIQVNRSKIRLVTIFRSQSFDYFQLKKRESKLTTKLLKFNLSIIHTAGYQPHYLFLEWTSALYDLNKAYQISIKSSSCICMSEWVKEVALSKSIKSSAYQKRSKVKKQCCPHWDLNPVPLGIYCKQ